MAFSRLGIIGIGSALTLCMGVAQASSAASLNGFTYKHKPVNPACLALINGSMADLPYVKEIDLDRCQTANATRAGYNGSTSYTNHHHNYSYRLIGKTKSNIFVIATLQSFGGSGQFQDLIMVTLQKKQRYKTNTKTYQPFSTPYTALTYLGSLGGGDRFTGSYQNLRVDGNDLIATRYRKNNAANQPGQSQDLVIHLDKVTPES